MSFLAALLRIGPLSISVIDCHLLCHGYLSSTSITSFYGMTITPRIDHILGDDKVAQFQEHCSEVLSFALPVPVMGISFQVHSSPPRSLL
jgi:hypothetical protein